MLSRGVTRHIRGIHQLRAVVNQMASAADIEDLHEAALQRYSTTYTDPSTGFMVFTELAHLERGVCCGNQCRHCPYGWSNVRAGQRRDAKVTSGDKEGVRALLEDIKARQQPLPTKRPVEPVADPKTGGRFGGRLTAKNVPYTRGGDKGTSQLLTGERRSKNDDAFEAMGTVDELCSIVGVVHAELRQMDGHEQLQEWLLDIMSRLFDIGSHVAKPRRMDDNGEVTFEADGIGGGFDRQHIQELEDWIDLVTEDLPELRSFILPTGAVASAQLHNARCVCRRAERRVVPLVQNGVCDPNALKYLNRLSDFFFSASRLVNYREGIEELQYRKPTRSSKQRGRVVVSPKAG